IVLSALLFGLGHVPLALTLGAPVTAVVITYLILGNAIFGLIAGYLYWRHGLESAMMAHMMAHLVMLVTVR
ncbi:CPBP family glutamic-type intramembrane protease, partial [Haemophilus parainfluenzae]|uniref:CPBP family glutamic-type intramembrane protease n=1 Tax=Haemophilus parainfluenzae TaxID=729 RepID=UPI00124AFA12